MTRLQPLLPEAGHELVGHGGVSKFECCCIACWIATIMSFALVLPHRDTSGLLISRELYKEAQERDANINSFSMSLPKRGSER